MISKTKPYVYIIKYEPTKQYYIGVKFAVGCSPETFWVDGGYYTSSPTIHALILENGKESFTIKRIRIFNTPEEAYSYETRLLRRVHARTNPKFLNKHENELFPYGSQALKELLIEKYGVDNVSKSPEIKEKKKQTSLSKFGVDNVMKSSDGKARHRQSVTEKYGVDNVSKSPEIKEKKKQTSLSNYGEENFMKTAEGKEMWRQSAIEKYGVDNVSKAPEIKEKKRQSAIEKYGVDNVSKSPEVKQKISDTFMKKYGFAYAAQHPDVIAKRTASQSRLALREEVSVIKQYVKRDRLKLGRGWYQRSTSDLQKMISEFVEKYGPL